MRALVVVESVFGNTRRIADEVARGLADGLGETGQVRVADVSEAGQPVDRVDLLVVGGPTHAFAMTRMSTRRSAAEQSGAQPAEIGLREWLATTAKAQAGARAAAFDTRMDRPRLPGSAAAGAARRLRRLGYDLVARPETFRVIGTQGPLRDGELDRARAWGFDVARAATSASTV
ncbi:flavodoxin [Pseudonocardia zijingensis]